MINHSDKNLRLSSTNSVVACLTRWDSSRSHVPHSSVSKNLNLNTNSRTQVSHQMNQGSSSTQSTGQWYPPFTGITVGGTQEQFISMPSGCNGADRWSIDGRVRSALSLGNSEKLYSASNADYGQSVVQMCYPYSDPLYGGIMPACLQNAMHLLQIHPQMVGVESNGRVPLPLELTKDGPIYVNAKQYRGILRRRQLRVKLEAQNKLVKDRKPYLHESRHLHAMKRVRGSGGRFLNTKQLQQAQEQNQQQQYKSSEIDCKIFSATSTGSSSSELTSNSNNSDIFQVKDSLGFAEFRAQVGGMHGVTSAKGSRHR